MTQHQLEGQEIRALEYLVSTSCGFLVELVRDADTGYQFRPTDSSVAGDHEHGQRFWRQYSKRAYPSPFEAAVMFVNAVRIWAGGAEATDRQEQVALH